MNKQTNISAWFVAALGIIIGMVIAVLGVTSSKVIPQPVGSVSSPDIQSRYFSYGGVRHWAARTTSLTQATTTVCAIQNPAAATSTVRTATLYESVSTTTASTITLAKSASAFATTTWLTTSDAISANATYHLELPATTTETGIDKYILGPSDWLVWSQAGGVGTFSPTGVCEATFTQL